MQVCLFPAPAAPGLSNSWTNSSIVTGRVQDPAAGVKWQGWYSQAYDDAWAAPTLVYDAVAPSVAAGQPAVFAWLLVPTAERGPCVGSGSSISVVAVSAGAGSVTVRVSIAGKANQDVPITTGL
jgi:hypothetical protein